MIVGIADDSLHDGDAVQLQHVQVALAEMRGTDGGNAHGCPIRLATASYPDITSGSRVTSRGPFAPVINNAPGAGHHEFHDCAFARSGVFMGAGGWRDHMRSAWFLLAVLVAANPAHAGGPYPAVPPEIG